MQLSDDLLVVEEAAFLDLGTSFDQATGNVNAIVTTVLKQGVVAAQQRGNTKARYVAQLRSQCDRAIELGDGLFETTYDKALKAVGEQLGMIETTLTRKFRGVSDQGVTTVVHEIVDDVNAEYAVRVADTLIVGAQSWDLELQAEGASTQGDRLVQRVLARSSVRGVVRHTGKGIWWKAFDTLVRDMRELSIGLSNQVTKRAIEGMNAAAEVR
jgi:hypothetical protein